MKTKAPAIALTTTAPAIKLEIKFDNEAVISNSVFFKLKIIKLTTILIVSAFLKKK